MRRKMIMKKLSDANNRINELLMNEDLQSKQEFNTLLENASNEYDYYKNLL